MSNKQTLMILPLAVSCSTTSSTNPIINKEVRPKPRLGKILKQTLSSKKKSKKTYYNTILSSLA